jgi:trehalose 6-phosphate synthase
VGLVTPLRDGMNLVAKEYVAAQSEEDPGVLVLSRFAGAADELDGAIIVNPYDLEAVAEAMHLGLTMPLDERQDRWRRLLAQVKQQDVVKWRHRYVQALARAPALEDEHR